ncbi:Adenylate cyclase 1 [Legionella massiliensis]|uniref:Adenylate cyclase 1 n=1 Tax=Legionella massiliensis TaxID=1034943 RepID=A0A078L5V7_9GAMM|nr:adenylate/guanylate cyclase domain-containing protein [Legionella massiliensis]CDZ79328.1 Adenylate cyclase 1 [Legionella massiliensis]CEE15066.1 Adenylate cyclase 1 [Legionella massiliensis]
MMLRGFKVSIRVSIITLFITLLSLTGFSIIGINYSSLNTILSSTAKNSIEQTSLLIKERLSIYLRPLNRNLLEIRNMINEGILDPSNHSQFDLMLLEAIRHDPNIYMVYFGTVDGDFYGAEREKNGLIALNHIVNSQSPGYRIHYELNNKNQITAKQTLVQPYDPRARPWYQQAVKAGKPVWTGIYQFVVFENNSNKTVLGITAAVPIYDKEHKLKGVLSMDITLDGLQKFVNQLQVSKNAMIYITSEDRQVIAYQNPLHQNDLRGEKLTTAFIRKDQIPLEAFDIEHLEPNVFSYVYKHKEFYIANQPVINNDKKDIWTITIIVPAADILGSLQNLSIHSLILAILILLLGTLVARYVSQKISKPIIQIAKETQEITSLNLEPRPLLKTIIKEISYMDKSLVNMRASLLSFQRYVPSSLVKKLMLSGQIAEVGGQRQALTILFSDIKNFTQLSEMTTPEKLMIYLSRYFQSMTESVIMHHGMLDKYIGDAVMALWNAPLADEQHALHACQTAVDMQARVAKLNRINLKAGLAQFSIRIAINSGDAVVGNVGSEERLNFTALGDAVNLTSRLEAINKIYHTQIIVSKSTFLQVETQFPFRLLDEVAVRGKHESTAIYELVLAENIENLEQHKKEFAQAFAYYQRGEWKESLELFKRVTAAYPGDYLATVYIERCQTLIDSPPEDWDGVWRIIETY